MKNWFIPLSLLGGWILSLVFCLYLSFDNMKLRAEIISDSKSIDYSEKGNISRSKIGEWEVFDINDMNYFRSQGKVDGKIEALLMMNKVDVLLKNDQIDKIIEIAEKSSANNLSENPQFLSLLCQAAYHKGISSTEEYKEEEYTKGYHKAIDDFTCPETGKITLPPKKELDMTKPQK